MREEMEHEGGLLLRGGLLFLRGGMLFFGRWEKWGLRHHRGGTL